MDIPGKGKKIMNQSDEVKTKEKSETNSEAFISDRVDIPTLKYFWQASPLASNKDQNIPKFLRHISVFQHFTDYELKLFSNYVHYRQYRADETIFQEGESGFGFYMILKGKIEVFARRNRIVENRSEDYLEYITRLSKYDYFGELALLEKQNKRNATTISKCNTSLLSIYTPDLEELIEKYPVVGTKFLQSLSLIVSRRLNLVVEEIGVLKEKIVELEKKLEPQEK